LSKLKRYDEAIEAAQAAFALDGTHWHSHDQILDALMDSGRVQEAESHAEALVSRSPDQVGALTAASRCFRRLNKPQRALELLNRSLASDRAGTAARAERGYARFEVGDYPGARADLESVLKRRPEATGVLCLLSDVLTRLGDFSEAASVAERLIRVDPDHHHAFVVLGRARFKSGAIQEGADALRQLLPHDNFAQMRLAAEVALEAQQLDLAQALVSRGIALRPRDPDGWLLRLEVLKAQSSHRPLPDELRELLRAFEREDLFRQRENLVKGIAAALTISVEHFGPKHVVAAVSVLRRFVSEGSEEGLLGQILAGFLARVLRQVEAPWEAWRSTLNTLRAEVGDLADCQIPLAFLEAALGFKETDDRRHLLQLPLELRQLLEEALLDTGKASH
jgi:tetratricopeptide (TPR) repeat protein